MAFATKLDLAIAQLRTAAVQAALTSGNALPAVSGVTAPGSWAGPGGADATRPGVAGTITRPPDSAVT